MPDHFRSIQCLSLAGRGRVMTEMRLSWRASVREISDIPEDAPLGRIQYAWISSSIAVQLRGASEELCCQGMLQMRGDRHDVLPQDRPCLQAALYHAIRSRHFHNNVENILRARLSHWTP